MATRSSSQKCSLASLQALRSSSRMFGTRDAAQFPEGLCGQVVFDVALVPIDLGMLVPQADERRVEHLFFGLGVGQQRA